MSFFNGDRCRALMHRENLTALIVQSPENMLYVSGHAGQFNKHLRNGLTAAAVVFADAARPSAMVLSDFELEPARRVIDIQDVRTYTTWIAVDRLEDLERHGTVERPTQPDPKELFTHLATIFRDRGVTSGRAGIEAQAISALAVRLLREALPNLELVPCDDLYSELRAVKAPGEVALLRLAAQLTELGIERAVGGGVRGISSPELALRFQAAVTEEALRNPLAGVTAALPLSVNVGPDPLPAADLNPYGTRDGDLVKFDCAVTVQGYHSDLARTYVLGRGDDIKEKLCGALLRGLRAGIELVKPGRPFRDIYTAAMRIVHRAGFSRYTRGHVGHAIGVSRREEGPFISPRSETVAEPGMTMTIELPYYILGLGAVMFEENFVVTRDGYELLTHRPVDYVRLER